MAETDTTDTREQEDDQKKALNRAVAEQGIVSTAKIKARFGGFDGNMGATRKVVHIDYWKKQAYPVIDVDGGEDAKRMAFKRARDKLREMDIVQTMDVLDRLDMLEEVAKERCSEFKRGGGSLY